MLKILRSPWEKEFIDLLQNAKKTLFLASPFIKAQTAKLIIKNCNKKIDFKYINSFKLANFHRGVSDLEALKIFDNYGVKQKSIHNLHAKFFIFDNKAVVTSANLTQGGLKNNFEYGVLMDGDILKKIKTDYLQLFKNDYYPTITADIINKAARILSSVPKEKRQKIKISDKKLFEDIINDENIPEKFDGGIESVRINLTSWKRDVFECLLDIKNDVFQLNDIYQFAPKLQKLHPANRNIRPKIRQQLQYLRNIGLIEFVQDGLYKKLWKE